MGTKYYEEFGSMVFSQTVMKERLPEEVYKSLIKTIAEGKTIDPSIADEVANAMRDWATELGATHYTHWFQPLSGVTAEKHESFVTPTGDGRAIMEFTGKELIKGEADSSSFPSGGLRATFEARGYTAWDPASFAFVKDGSLYIPTAFCSYNGDALDMKTPLLRSLDAVSKQALRLLRILGDTETQRVDAEIGAEQEYFLIDKEMYRRRKDLVYTGRTLIGAPPAKGQELNDHYLSTLNPRVLEFMQELDRELWKLGINARTRHGESAPAQHELAPVYTTTDIGVDQNLLIMELMKKIADRHGLACLLHEKPFDGVNGSGKHDNWSLSANGKNLFKPGKTPEEFRRFLLMLAAVVMAVDNYADLYSLAVASPSNDLRLGGYEAPPSIISIFVGEDLEKVIDDIIDSNDYSRSEREYMDLGIPSIPTIKKDTTDRNRTSPIAFTGNKFEFRMPGSSQNMAMMNIVINTTVADSLAMFADRLKKFKGDELNAEINILLTEVFTGHKRILYSGNGYSEKWAKEAKKRGLNIIDNSLDAYNALMKNKDVFMRYGIMSYSELKSRYEILYENYSNCVRIEAKTLYEMIMRDVLPASLRYTTSLCNSIKAEFECAEYKKPKDEEKEDNIFYDPFYDYDENSSISAKGIKRKKKNKDKDNIYHDYDENVPTCTYEIEVSKKVRELTDYLAAYALMLKDSIAISDDPVNYPEDRAELYRDDTLKCMRTVRKYCDELEMLMPSELWPYPSYGDMLFSV